MKFLFLYSILIFGFCSSYGQRYGYVVATDEEHLIWYFSKVYNIDKLDCSFVSRASYGKNDLGFFGECCEKNFQNQLTQLEIDLPLHRFAFTQNGGVYQGCENGNELVCFFHSEAEAEAYRASVIHGSTLYKTKIIN